MKRCFLLILIFSQSLSIHGQVPDLSGVVSSVCDTLNRVTVPLHSLGKGGSTGLILQAIHDNQEEWQSALSALEISDEPEVYDLVSFLKQLLKLDCPDYRIIEDSSDQYLVERYAHLRPAYFRAKSFKRALEDNREETHLLKYLSDSLNNFAVLQLIRTAKAQIEKYKRNCTVSNLWVDNEGNTFRVRYAGLRSGNTMFQIDLVFKDINDELIDVIRIKEYAQLEVERKQLIEFNRRIESGEIKLPPPPTPPPSGIKNK